MKKVLITGISGFAGSFLTRLLHDTQSYQIAGTYNSGKGLDKLNDIASTLKLFQVDLTDAQAIGRVISETKPNVIYHLAALASPSQSFKDPVFTLSTNVAGQINLLEAVHKNNLSLSRILIVSSAEVYGMVKEDDLPIDENTPMRPVSPYAVSKITQDYLGLQYYYSYKLQVIRARPFNHIGPGQTPAYAVAAFAEQIAKIERNEQEPVLHVGNLSARRDFTDVRDIVRAYTALVEKGEVGQAYNIGSGVSYEMSEILSRLIALSSVKISIETNKERLMPVDIPDNRCDNSKIMRQTGWKPQVPLDESLRDVLDYWRKIS